MALRDLSHIHQTAELAERVLLPGDPGRALRLAQALLEAPKMLNHNRGLWGYTGSALFDGELLSIQSTGMGGPSAAIVVSELVELGARRLLRIGTCGALEPSLELGQLIVVSEAIADDGASVAIGPHAAMEPVAPTPGLFEALRRAAANPAGDRPAEPSAGGGPLAAAVGPVVSSDLFYDADHRTAAWRQAGALAVEMEAAVVFALAARRGVEAGCALLVSNSVGDHARWLAPEALHLGELALGELATRALS